MFLGIYKDTDGKIKSRVYHSFELWHRDIFSPIVEILKVIDFEVCGKTYEERKENLKSLAIDFQTSDIIDLSYGELAEICDFFQKNARYYGLVKEFKENGII